MEQVTASSVIGTTARPRILLADDDENTIRLLAVMFERAGIEVLSATSGPQALRLTFEHHPDVILLDVKMPDMDGLTVCQRLRDLSDVPIIMVTALTGSDCVREAFAAGADDYVTKPFDTAELVARVQVCLRRAAKASEPHENLVLGHSELIIDLRRHRTTVRGREIHLTPSEFELLVYMARNHGRVLTHEMLMAALRGDAAVNWQGTLKQFIRTLRTKIENDPCRPQWLLSERGIGYVLALD